MQNGYKEKRIERNFNKRFGGRIIMVFPNKLTGIKELRWQNYQIYKALHDVLTGILGREPTINEMLGIEDLIIKQSHIRKEI